MWMPSVEDIISDKAYVQRGLVPEAFSGDRLLTLAPFDRLTVEHMRRVARLARMAAAWLALDPNEVRVITRAALLHDLGKAIIPPSILNKPGRLSEDEWEIVRRHPEIGAGLLSEISGFASVREVVAAHHERPDGGGYPVGLAGPDIPIQARLIAVVDAYDAMTNDRPYREALSHNQAIEQLTLGSGSQFDPMAIEAVEAALIQAPHNDRGSTSRRVATGVEDYAGSLAPAKLAPRVLVLPRGMRALETARSHPVAHA